MTWEIALGIFTLLGSFITAATIVYKLSSVLAKLQSTLDTLNGVVAELKKINIEEHKTFNEKILDLQMSIHDIEVRLGFCNQN